MTYLADRDPDNPLTPLQAASCTYRIALGPRFTVAPLALFRQPDPFRTYSFYNAWQTKPSIPAMKEHSVQHINRRRFLIGSAGMLTPALN